MNDKKEAPRPFTLRLTPDERARLESEAGNQPLGAYMRRRLLEEGEAPRKMRGQHVVKDRQELSRALAKLGTSELSASLVTLAEAARTGALAVPPETYQTICAACDDVQAMRAALIKALGLKPE